MKKVLAVLMALTTFLVGCAKADQNPESSKETVKEASGELETVEVASHTSRMTDILELIKDDMKEAGYNLEIVKVSDNVQANVALQNREVDANFFQHEPFMQQFNDGNDGDLIKATPVYNALVAFYSNTVKSLDELKDGAVVAIPNDPTNRTRALRMLASSGLIKLDDPESYNLEVSNVSENPKNLVFKEWGLLNLNEAFKESDLTFNYPTYIDALGLKPETDGLILEPEADQTFAITLAARKENVDSDELRALIKAINSEKVKEFIETNLKGHAKVAF